MSKLSDSVLELICLTYPGYSVYPEYHVNYCGHDLFFDFFIKDLNLYVECQGIQHYKHVRHFHPSVRNFRQALQRDVLKQRYVKEKGHTLIYVYSSNLPENRLGFLQLVNKGLKNGRIPT